MNGMGEGSRVRKYNVVSDGNVGIQLAATLVDKADLLQAPAILCW